MSTLAEQLVNVQAAISTIETTGQSYTIDGFTYNRAGLKTLYDREARLLSKIEKAANTGRRVAEF